MLDEALSGVLGCAGCIVSVLVLLFVAAFFFGGC